MKKFYTLMFFSIALVFSQKAIAQPTCHASFYLDTVASTPFNGILVNTSTESGIIFPDSIVHHWIWGDGTDQMFVKNPTHTYTSAGVKTIKLLLFNNYWSCFDTFIRTITIDSSGGFHKTNAGYTLTVVNPKINNGLSSSEPREFARLFSSFIENTATVKFEGMNNGTPVKVDVYSLDGKNVLSTNSRIDNNSMTLETARLQSGAYIISLNVEGKITVLKMIKQ